MRILPALVLLACNPSSGDAVDSDTGVVDSEETTANLAELPVYTGGTCPTLVHGDQGFASGSDTRDVRIDLPTDPNGAPVVFVWHWLNGTADQMVDWSGISTWVDDHDVIVVAPTSLGLQVEWDSWSGDNNDDTILFDDLLTCLADQFDVDRTRIYTTGMSAGGLWTVTLAHHRSEFLAAAAPMSGGATQTSWVPDEPTPMLLTWGGSSDTYGNYSFDDGNNDLSAQLIANDQFQVHCIHDEGHTLPSSGMDYVWDFFAAHPRGSDEPWAAGLPSSVPSWCAIP